MLSIDTLKEFGANTDEGLKRCFGKADFYLRLVKTVPGEGNFQRLADAVAAGDLDGAFEAAHALKGISGNLSLTPIYDPINEMTELLRTKQSADYASMAAKVLARRDELKALIES